MKSLFVVSPKLDEAKSYGDGTVALMIASQIEGHDIFVTTQEDIITNHKNKNEIIAKNINKLRFELSFVKKYYQQTEADLRNGIKIKKQYFRNIKKDFLSLNENYQEVTINQQNFDIIHLRNDPPYNKNHNNFLLLMENLQEKEKISIFNNPHLIRTENDKDVYKKYPDYCPKTKIFSDNNNINKLADNIYQWAKSINKKYLILKPDNSSGGIGVIKTTTDKNHISQSLQKMQKIMQLNNSSINNIVVQEFIENIKFGDVRVIVSAGTIIGAIKRVPKKGQYIANLRAGGLLKKANLSKEQIKICHKIAQDYKTKALYLGIDLIGGCMDDMQNITNSTNNDQKQFYIGEINYGSTMGFTQIDFLNNISIDDKNSAARKIIRLIKENI